MKTEISEVTYKYTFEGGLEVTRVLTRSVPVMAENYYTAWLEGRE